MFKLEITNETGNVFMAYVLDKDDERLVEKITRCINLAVQFNSKPSTSLKSE